MIKPDVSERPSSSDLAEHPIISPVGERSKNQLFDELQEEQRKNSVLAKYVPQHLPLHSRIHSLGNFWITWS